MLDAEIYAHIRADTLAKVRGTVQAANPLTQLAFTLANGFTLVEYYLGQDKACLNSPKSDNNMRIIHYLTDAGKETCIKTGLTGCATCAPG